MIKSQTKKDLSNNKGTKDDIGKIDLTYMDPHFEEMVNEILAYGGSKYKRGNWQLDLEPNRLFKALKRHTMAIQKGEYLDEESGFPHVGHIACNSMFIDYYHRHGILLTTEHDKG